MSDEPSAIAASAGSDPLQPGPPIRVRSWEALWASTWPSIRFLFQTEVHVYSFAVAANILISFFPFLVAIVALCRYALHWQAAVDVVIHTVNDYFPEGFGVNFRGYLLGAAYHRFSWLSVGLLFFAANGIFVPLEVALNRIWRVKQNRSFVPNQAISLGLTFICGILVLASVSATTVNVQYLTSKFGSSHVGAVLQTIAFKMTALAITAAMMFLVYWILPNAKIPVRRLIPASIAVAVLLEISKYLNILTWPWLRSNLRSEVPPFVQSISIILWSFVATLIVLAGAEWSARVIVEGLDDGNASPERANARSGYDHPSTR